MSLSMPDKMIRLSLATYPSPLDLSQFYPALSTYQVERAFDRQEIETAVSNFLTCNPFFSKCHIAEWEFESAKEFPLSSFQGVAAREYPNYSDGFLLASVTYAGDPHTQGIFTAFPISLQDGYRCFHFHQALMRSLKSRRDEFNLGDRLSALQVRTDELSSCMPDKDPAPAASTACPIPFKMAESTGPPLKIGPYLDTVRAQFLKRSCENLYIVKNALGASTLPVGSFLLFLHAPFSVVEQGGGAEIHNHCRVNELELRDRVASLGHSDDFAAAGSGLIPEMLKHPHRFIVNNYGDVSEFDGFDSTPSKGRLVKYQWHMPNVVLCLMSGARDGVSWTITIRDEAFNFKSL